MTSISVSFLLCRTNAKATESTYLSAKDPFIVLEAASNPAYGSSDSFTDALDELGKLTQSGATKPDGPSTASRTLKPPPKPSQVLKVDEGHFSSFYCEDLVC